jgi:hypothetical protein
MNDEQRDLIEVVKEMISGTLNHYDEDPTHAPAKWLLMNWWHTLNAVLVIDSQVGNHCDSKLNSFKPTDEAESKKRHEDVQTDETFEV